MDDDFDDLEWRPVGAATQWPDQGSARVVTVGARKIAILRGASGWYAFKNNCPHRNLPLIPNDGTSTHLSCEQNQVHCPHHGWPFELASGEGPNGSCLRTYPVREMNGQLEVGV